MKKSVLIVALLMLFTTFNIAQQTNIPKELHNKANTAKDADYLSNSEKKVILYMNLARIDGKWFVKNIISNHPNSKYSTDNLNSLISDLKKTKNIPPLKPAKGLTKAATYHAKDMGEKGKTGHNSSDGTGTFIRIKKYAKGGYMAENCSYGYSDPLDIVMQLLVDDGVPSLGHRKSILSINYTHVGIAIEPHKAYKYNCVQDFSDTGD